MSSIKDNTQHTPHMSKTQVRTCIQSRTVCMYDSACPTYNIHIQNRSSIVHSNSNIRTYEYNIATYEWVEERVGPNSNARLQHSTQIDWSLGNPTFTRHSILSKLVAVGTLTLEPSTGVDTLSSTVVSALTTLIHIWVGKTAQQSSTCWQVALTSYSQEYIIAHSNLVSHRMAYKYSQFQIQMSSLQSWLTITSGSVLCQCVPFEAAAHEGALAVGTLLGARRVHTQTLVNVWRVDGRKDTHKEPIATQTYVHTYIHTYIHTYSSDYALYN